MTTTNVLGETGGCASRPKPQARPRRIDIATPPATPITAIAVATCRSRNGKGFHYRAIGSDGTWSGSTAAANQEAAVLDAMTAIRAQISDGDRVRFLVSVPATSSLWRHQDEIAALLPGASIEWPGICNLHLMEAARNALTVTTEHVAPTPPETSPLTVATDGSVRRGYTGIGWLACDGQYGLSGFRHTGKRIGPKVVLISELRAIIDAVDTLRDRPLTVASDSTSAIDMVTKWMQGCDLLPHGYSRFDREGRTRDLVVAQQMIYAARKRLTLTWVRGHQGEPLNEGADALARLARRRAASPADLTTDDYNRRAADLAAAFSKEYNRAKAAA